ncbi:2Fe-2S iron-sulfur cluster-binding protein [Arenicella xantha]|uniref:2Fe-2S ferredoxin n=1 Tax=Arenicella xantha TaxID=644221 RepID=A0A395JLH9_9GAMM|nr:2Fe-2S iron-sulfur cluster-binding protein [Arenicella xantha]RBP51459.1 2Fe-2S ferredoxin [Arenicella xantha]
MPNITFIDYQGAERAINAASGDTVMEVATSNDVPGIDADCGGACACATCHVYIDSAWVEVVGAAQDLESEMLEVAEGVEANSRLACQIVITDEMDGLIVKTPESQF